MQACTWSVDQLLTHSGDKVLLGNVLSYGSESLIAEACVKADSVYLKGDSEPGWMGLEYMAQAVAALAGIRQRLEHHEPKVGMLIGTRRYRCSVKNFPVGMVMRIETRALLEDELGLSVFQCRIFHDELIAEANLSVYQPTDIQAYLSSEQSSI
jgi:predicted hotdog family 3-hydroxylacyl-ACP dehydratase